MICCLHCNLLLITVITHSQRQTTVARSCRFALLNIRKIRPYLTQHATQLLVQAMVISRLDYCNALLTGLPACAVKPLQMVQNAAARLVFGSHLLECSCKGLCHNSVPPFIAGLWSSSASTTFKTIQTHFMCRSTMVE